MSGVINFKAFAFIATLAFSAMAYADTYSPLDVTAALNQADHIRLVRILAAEFDAKASLECRYKYRSEVLQDFKGDAPVVFYSSESALVGSRYLLIGKLAPVCGRSTMAIEFPGSNPLVPLLPYGMDRPDAESWLALGAVELVFPPWVRLIYGPACHLPTSTGSLNPCLVPPPLVNFMDMKDLLNRVVKKRS